MLRRVLIPVMAAALVVVLLAPEAHAWGAFHSGYTHVGPGGAYHVGHTGVGGYGGAYGHVGAVGGYGGVYHAGYAAPYTVAPTAYYGGVNPYYAPSYSAGYYGGGFRAGAIHAGGYRAGVYRRW